MRIVSLDYLEFLTEGAATGGFVATYPNTTARSGFGSAEAGALAIGDATATAAFTSTDVYSSPFFSATRSRASASATSGLSVLIL
jgi:hypothetical protein